MTTVRTPIASVDAIQRVPVACWLGPWDPPAGFPNYPVWTDTNSNPVIRRPSRCDVLREFDFGQRKRRCCWNGFRFCALDSHEVRVPDEQRNRSVRPVLLCDGVTMARAGQVAN